MASYQQCAQGLVKGFVLSDNWAEPYTIDELAIDRKKITEITSWLSAHRNKVGILLLTGPTGCGKTTVVKCVARSLGFEVREWITPLDRDYHYGAESGVFQNQTEKFEDYLYSCSRYADLFVQSSTAASVLLVEDYPNIFLLKPEIFHDVLGKYCATARAPIVFICSNVADKSLNIEMELFPISVQMKLGMAHTSLNPVIRLKMTQALRRMGAILQTLNSGYKPPSQDALNEICDSANGDIRYAMLSLQMKPQEDVAALFDSAGRKGAGRKKSKLTQEEEVVTSCGKDDRVGILHAAGRVLYPKWQTEADKLNNSVKRKRKGDEKRLDASVPGAEWVHDPSSIVNSYLSSASSLMLLVQENYLKTFSTIESVAAASMCLSQADITMSNEGVDVSHEINFNAVIRGVMVNNKVPNRAFTPVKGSRFYELSNIQKKVSSLTETQFSLYPTSLTVLMMDIIPYMSHICIDQLSSDQRNFVRRVASMESLASLCDTFRNFKEPQKEQNTEKISFAISDCKEPVSKDNDELHISEDESDTEVDTAHLSTKEVNKNQDKLDEGAENLSWLEAALDEAEQQQAIDYHALLNDSDDDDILSSQM